MSYNNNITNSLSNARRIVFVGEGETGKTCFLEIFKEKKFRDEYVPTRVDNLIGEIYVKNEFFTFVAWDTCGKEKYQSILSCTLKDSDIVALCYSVEEKMTYEAIWTVWLPIVKNYCPDAELVLVAMKTDLRDKSNGTNATNSFVTSKEGEALCKKINGFDFIETSAKNSINIQEVFIACARAMIKKRQNQVKRPWYRCFCC